MENKPVYYDGSGSINLTQTETHTSNSIKITPEMRRNIGVIPYQVDNFKRK
ncbi:hypothetical protein [Peribacillus cavernae]|uniref:hypothetical protein n=1 Tax=Peribacillus cavernae TaxID=1674310 RepID=UPI00163D17F6|nr:hypothetical protein [Peribacillus cavernae]MDQ0219290.1 hypothetical protein [Peribacillus cavernae]